jgi:hypothetical protein
VLKSKVQTFFQVQTFYFGNVSVVVFYVTVVNYQISFLGAVLHNVTIFKYDAHFDIGSGFNKTLLA